MPAERSLAANRQRFLSVRVASAPVPGGKQRFSRPASVRPFLFLGWLLPAGFDTPQASCPQRHGTCWKKPARSEEHTSELQSHLNLVCRLLLPKKKIFSQYLSYLI